MISVSATAFCSLTMASASFFALSIVKLNSFSFPPVSLRSVVFSFSFVGLGTDVCDLGPDLVGVVVPEPGALEVEAELDFVAATFGSFTASEGVFFDSPILREMVTGAAGSAAAFSCGLVGAGGTPDSVGSAGGCDWYCVCC